jgi:hypothetical protein
MPFHWNKAVLNLPFCWILSDWSWKRHCKGTQYKTIAKELLLQEFMPEIQTVNETLIFFNKNSLTVNKNLFLTLEFKYNLVEYTD